MNRISLAWVVGAGALVLAADFPWGDLRGHPHWGKIAWVPFVSPPLNLLDVAQNLLLCAPIGVTAALRFRKAPAAAAVIALGVGLVGEWTQLYSHSRFPSATDLACNLTGAVATTLIAGATGHGVVQDN